jgi:hypothetical protein
MSNGSLDPESPKDVQCEHCGLYFRNDGIRPHEEYCDRRGKDPLQPILSPEDVTGDTPAEEGGDLGGEAPDPTPEGEGLSPDEGDGPGDAGDDQEVATDGAGLGLSGPPRASSNDTAPSNATPSERTKPSVMSADQLPDRYVAVDRYLEEVEDRAGGVVNVDVLREQLSDYDIVDVDATTEDNIVAYTLDEAAEVADE